MDNENEVWNQATKGVPVTEANNSNSCMGRAMNKPNQDWLEGTTELGKGAMVSKDTKLSDGAADIGSPRMENEGKEL